MSSVEAYAYHQEYFAQPAHSSREVVGSQAFNLEYQRQIADEELYDEIVSYLGEYRLSVPKYEYELVYTKDPDGKEGYKVRDIYNGDSMHTKAKRSIQERRNHGEPIHRELAEEKGIRLLEQQLIDAKTGDSLLWLSPPGPKDQGYGEYAFLYHGTISRQSDGSSHLAMKAIRVDKPTIEAGNNFFARVTDRPYSYKTPEDFIANPVVLPFTLPEPIVDRMLASHFEFEDDASLQLIFKEVIGEMEPQIWEFIRGLPTMTRAEKITSFHALENYALALKKRKEKTDVLAISIFEYKKSVGVSEAMSLAYLTKQYGYEPPKAGGSCGSTSTTDTTSTLLSSSLSFLKGTALAEFILGDEITECEHCQSLNTDNHYHCPGCNKKYDDETNKPSDKRTKECTCGFEFGC